MDIFLIVLGFVLVLLGIVGSFLPVLPGPLTGWFGLLVLHLTSAVPMNWIYLGITLAVAVLIWMLDYIIPGMGTKKFGGSRYGVYGTTIGLIIGLLSPIPFGILIGAFFGAFVGELLYDSKDTHRALKASLGSFIGLLASATMKFAVATVFVVMYILKLVEYRSDFF